MKVPCRAAAPAAALLVCLILPPRGTQGSPPCIQDGKPAAGISEKLDLADKLAQQRKYEEAGRLYEEAAVDAHAAQEFLLESRALAARGRILQNQSRFAEAQTSFTRALELAEAGGDGVAVAQVANSLGTMMEDLGRRDEAMAYYTKSARSAEAVGNSPLKIRAHINGARLESDIPKKEATFRDAAEDARKLGERELEATATRHLGDMLFLRGDYAAAMERFVQAAAIYVEIGGGDGLARVYTSMGRLNRTVGRPREAIPYYRKALSIQRGLGDKIGVVQSLNAMSVAYRALGDSRREVEFLEEARVLALETGSPRVIDFISANLAGALSNRQGWARAAELLEEVLHRGYDSLPGLRQRQLAYAYMKLGRLDEARRHADLAVEMAAQDIKERATALFIRAETRQLQGDLSGARRDALDCIESIERMRARLVPLDYMKQGFSRQYQNGHSLLIGLHHAMGEPEKALAVAELTRARAFLDLLATREIRLKADDQSEVAALRRAAEELRGLGMDPFVEAKQGGSTSITPDKAVFLQQWQSARPELLSFVAAKPGDATEVAAAAARLRSVILSYWVTEDALFIWAVRPDGKVALRRVGVTERRLASLVSAASSIGRQTGRSRGGAAPSPTLSSRLDWSELYRLLVLPVRRFLPPPGTRLTIIPHGPLMRLSFAALADANGRYLLEDYPIHYAPAAALLEFTSRKKHDARGGRRFLLVADPELPPPSKGETALPRLPGARKEVRSIAGLLPPGAATILEGRSADEKTVAEAMSRSSVLHLATHGIARDDEPLDSYLALGRSGDPTGDGRLTAQKIYGYDTRAELAVLSACRSGGDKITGEGIAVLARAFFYAGTPSLVVSLWDVADETAERLLPDFYGSWIKGDDKIEALRAAQLRLLADLRAGRVRVHTVAGDFTLPEDPILWAGFVLLGEPR